VRVLQQQQDVADAAGASVLDERPLQRERVLVKISDELTYHREVLDEIKRRIRTSYAPGSKFGVAEFKQLFDLTRKHAIPLLEFLDRERFTRRQGNDRVLL